MKLITNPYIRFINSNDTNTYLAITKPGIFIPLSKQEYFFLQKKIFTLKDVNNYFDNARLKYLMTNNLIMKYDLEFDQAQKNILARQYGWMSIFDTLDNQKKISKTKVLVLGCGGLGTKVVQSLSRLGTRNFILLDYDKVELTNLNRQEYFERHDVGKFKVDVISEKLKEFDSNITVKTIKRNIISKESLIDCLNDFIDTIDIALISIDTPIDYLNFCTEFFMEHKIPFTTGAAVGDMYLVGPTYSPKLKNRFLKNMNIYRKNGVEVSGINSSSELVLAPLAVGVTSEMVNLMTNNLIGIKANGKAKQYLLFPNKHKFKSRNILAMSILASLLLLSPILHVFLLTYLIQGLSMYLPLKKIITYKQYFLYLFFTSAVVAFIHEILVFHKSIFLNIFSLIRGIESIVLTIVLSAAFTTIIFLILSFVIENIFLSRKYSIYD
ncbi:hypothetical protein SN811_00500 [Ligilactobacillus agilis]|uniref:THIF-type NAD/FAD binding fold domain-containing protein n=1 Tax=Ligilactobacillus agilis TaxID=1601 RepID=A0A6F9Y2I5_9LACO|nr:ThiF family adenylyltransferase [Ligilactobacillus agilis]GET11550.1 hypothetical protein SN811_00500 [Ligilactobacillus agilis]